MTANIIPPRDRTIQRAFTLIELLVVITIVALLMTLLLPALRGAAARAREVQCVHQMRQLAVVCLTFARDNKRAVPMGITVNPATLRVDVASVLDRYMRENGVPSNVWYCTSLHRGVWSGPRYNEPLVTPAEWMTSGRPPLSAVEFRIG